MNTSNTLETATGPIHVLRLSGFKVRITHERFVASGKLNKVQDLARVSKALKRDRAFDYIWPKGGRTVVEVRTPEGKDYVKEAVCSTKDAFNRRLGITICLNRLMNESPEIATVLA